MYFIEGNRYGISQAAVSSVAWNIVLPRRSDNGTDYQTKFETYTYFFSYLLAAKI